MAKKFLHIRNFNSPLVPLASRAFKDLPVQSVFPVRRVLLVLLVISVKQVLKDLAVLGVPWESSDLKESPAAMVKRVLAVLSVLLVSLVILEKRVPPVCVENKENLEVLVQRVKWVIKDERGLLDLPVLKVPLVFVVLKENLDHVEFQDLKDLEVLMDRLVHKDLKVSKANKAPWDKWVSLAQRVQKDLLVLSVQRENLVSKVHLELEAFPV